MSRLIKRYLNSSAVIFAVLAPIAMFVEVFMDLMQPRLLEKIIDVGVANQDLSYVYATGVRMVLVALTGMVGGAACSFFASYAATDMSTKLRQGLFDKIQTLSFLEIDQLQASSLITRLTNDVTQVQNMFVMLLRGAVRAPLLCVGGIIMAVSSSAGLSVIFIVVVPIIISATVLILTKSFPLFTKVQQRIDRINLVMRESILGVRVIKALTIEKEQRDKFDVANQDLMDNSMKAQNRNMMLWPIVTLVMNFSIVSVLWFGGNMVHTGNLEIGKIMSFVNYLIQIMNSLIMVVTLVLNFSRAMASADRINEVMDAVPSIQNASEQQKMTGYDIEFDHVFFKYNAHSDDVLSDISLNIKEGEKIGIIGSTGSGKSSFIQLIPRLYDATQGQIRIGGVNVKDIALQDLRDKIGIVLQESILFSGSIASNIRFGKADASQEQMEEAAKSAQAEAFVNEKENGFEHLIEQRGKNFSGGQKQRLSITRTLVRNPKILIMDDSTSALDVATEARLQYEVKKKMSKSTVIMIAQRVSAVMDADQIIVMEHGKVEAMGDHKTLLHTSDIYRTIAVSQLGEEVLLDA